MLLTCIVYDCCTKVRFIMYVATIYIMTIIILQACNQTFLEGPGSNLA